MEDFKAFEREFHEMGLKVKEIYNYIVGQEHDIESGLLFKIKDNEKRLIQLEEKIIEKGEERMTKIEKTLDRVVYGLIGAAVVCVIMQSGLGAFLLHLIK